MAVQQKRKPGGPSLVNGVRLGVQHKTPATSRPPGWVVQSLRDFVAQHFAIAPP
jgi:hypothetical protein